MPVHKAVAALAIPTIISQIVSIIYNLADTFFIGQLGDPYMVAAVTLVYPWFNLLTALGNLFGIGGSSLAARLLGAKRGEEVKYVSSFCFYGGVTVTLLFSLLSVGFRMPLLRLLGASAENTGFAQTYLLWVVGLGGVPTMLSMTLGINMGLCQGFMPLVAYNYAAKNYPRMKAVSLFSWKSAFVIALCFVACFAGFSPYILRTFIPDGQTGAMGASFLRIACLAVPFTSVNALIIYTLQTMGKGTTSSILTLCRQGFLNIPLLFLMNWAFGLYGMIWTQLVIELVMLPITLGMYRLVQRREKFFQKLPESQVSS